MAKKILFIDRDGTLIVEPPDDFQIDSLEDLEFVPKCITALAAIAESNEYELVLVTNQDGLGTNSFPEQNFWPAHHKMLRILAGEGILFTNQHIDRSFEHEKLPTRKPQTGMLTQYLHTDEYDLANSYVIGDRFTDVLLAQNLGTKAILLDVENQIITEPNNDAQIITKRSYKSDLLDQSIIVCNDWDQIRIKLALPDRIASVHRKTLETEIQIMLNLDGQGQANIHTGLGFFDHMLHQLARHGGLDLNIHVFGDLHIDEHHTIEDTAIALGECFSNALAAKKGINRYGFLLPMDDCLAQVAIDFSGRPWLVWEADFKREKIGDMPTEMFYHFFKSFTDGSRANLNIKAEGQNEHHKIEAIYKAFAKAIRMACIRNPKFADILPSTKGLL